MVCEGTKFSININFHYYIAPRNKPNNTIVSLRKIINENFNLICYYSKYVVPSSLRPMSQKYFGSLTPLHVSMEEHDNIMDENNQIEGIESDRSF